MSVHKLKRFLEALFGYFRTHIHVETMVVDKLMAAERNHFHVVVFKFLFEYFALPFAENILFRHYEERGTPFRIDEFARSDFFYVRIIVNVAEVFFQTEFKTQIASGRTVRRNLPKERV